jgi:hypothetical protein
VAWGEAAEGVGAKAAGAVDGLEVVILGGFEDAGGVETVGASGAGPMMEVGAQLGFEWLTEGGFESMADAFGAAAVLDGVGDGARGDGEVAAVAGEGLPTANLEEVEEEVGRGVEVEAELPVGGGVAEHRGRGRGNGRAGGAAQELTGPSGKVIGDGFGETEVGDVVSPAPGVVEGVEEGMALVGEGSAKPAGRRGGGGDRRSVEVN